MGRPAKNPEHPLTRLRKALSTPTQEITRALFSRKVGIPEATIKAIETGKFKLSDKNAAQIAAVTGVNPKCLIDSSLPLADQMGRPFEEQGPPHSDAFYLGEYLDLKELFCAAVEVAEEKQKYVVFSFVFQQWLEETSEILGLREAVTNKLLVGYPLQCFAAIPKYFWPTEPKRRDDLVKRVKRFEAEFAVEFTKTLFPEMRATSSKMLADQLINAEAEPATANAEPAKKRIMTKRLQELVTSLARAVVELGVNFAKFHWDLRRKMIEEAKASLQKQPKRLQTR